jgi:hypothetical protein
VKNTIETIKARSMALKEEGIACADDLWDLTRDHGDGLENLEEYTDYLIAMGRLNDRDDKVISGDQMWSLLDLLD